MTSILLLDLDDTLLVANMQNFIPAYFKVLSETLQDIVSPEKLLSALMGGTRKMMGKSAPERTLKEVFDEYFFDNLAVEEGLFRLRIDEFYENVFPKLKYLTKQRPDAIDFVKKAFYENYQIVIATNPVFPIKAINHRLRWAGLAPEDFPFTLVTSYETSHFTKENISYFPEILGKLGWMEESVVMVGNDIKMDIEPALNSGLPVYWIKEGLLETNDPPNIPQGKFKDLQVWLKNIPHDSLKHSIETPSSLLAVLRSTPAVLESDLGRLSEEKLNEIPGPGEWSIKEVICHLRDVEFEVNISRIRRILNQENPLILGENTDRWAIERNYHSQNGNVALISFIQARKETIRLLENLLNEWERPARHSIFGSYTLKELVGVIAGHDKNHIRQIHNISN